MHIEEHPDVSEGRDVAADTGPDLLLQPLLAPPPQPGISPLPTYVLSGAGDPSLAQQARSIMFGLLCAIIGGFKLARPLSWLQFSCVIILPSCALAASLALMCACPQAYRRKRLHLWTHPLLQFVTLVSVSIFRSAVDAVLPIKEGQELGGIPGALAFLTNLLLLSGLTSAVAIFPVYQTPPVSTAAAVAVWTVLLSTTNSPVCGAELLQQPLAAWHLRLWYRALEPLVAPLEPLLLAAGIGSSHPTRHCHCVLVALQFWVVALAIPLLVARGQVKRYTAWRAQQRQQDQQRRRDLGEAWGFGFQEPSSSSDDGSSEGGSGVQSPRSLPHGLREMYSQLLRPTLPTNDVGPASAALRTRRPGMLPVRLYQGQPVHRHHPADWQYVRALRVLRMLRPTTANLAALTLSGGV